MRVKCVNIINPITGSNEASSLWLKVGAEYTILSVHIRELYNAGVSANLRGQYRIQVEDSVSPALFDVRQFEVVSNKLPTAWVIETDEAHSLYLGPEEWRRIGFWEDYFNDVPDAVRQFLMIRDRIWSES